MSRELLNNVNVDGKWYGPDHGSSVPPSAVAEKITNPAAWADSERPGTAADLRFRSDDYAASLAALAPTGAEGVGPSADALGEMSPDDLAAYASARGVESPSVRTKGDRDKLIAQLTA